MFKIMKSPQLLNKDILMLRKIDRCFLRQSFKIPRIQLLLKRILNLKEEFASTEDFENQVVAKANLYHKEFIQKLKCQESAQAYQSRQPMQTTYCVTLSAGRTFSLKCNQARCKFRFYFSMSSDSQECEEFNFGQSIRNKKSEIHWWHSYPLH